MPEPIKRQHFYHAEATVLEGHLSLPLVEDIERQAYAKLPAVEGGYISEPPKGYRLGSVISYSSAYTQVAGHPDVKPGHGWSALATAVVEDFNVLDILTADRVVAQISTSHPLVGYVPSVSFLGTRFENLRIAGHPVEVKLDLDLLGPKPANDAPYSRDRGFLDKISSQYQPIRHHEDVPGDLHQRYNRLPAGFGSGKDYRETVECSLVNHVDGSYPGKSFGHAIRVPNFGVIHLATVHLEQSGYQEATGIFEETLFRLTMIELQMGCPVAGQAQAAALVINGHTKP
jgi:hypothetical protein